MINKATLFERINRIYTIWKTEDLHSDTNLSKVDCLIFFVGNENQVSNKNSSALMMWLFGSTIYNTIAIIEKNMMHVLTTPENFSIFQTMTESEKDSTYIKLHVLNDGNEYKDSFETLTGAIESHKKIIGIFVENNCKTDFTEAWKTFLENRYDTLDISNDIAAIMAIKDLLEINQMKNAGLIVQSAMLYINQSLISIVCNNEIVSHHQLAEEVIYALMYKNWTKEKSEIPVNKRYYFQHMIETIDTVVQKDDCQIKMSYPIEMCYYPIINSGGIYSYKFDAGSNNDVIKNGVITYSVGIKFNNYCCNLTRTLMMYPTKNIVANYKFLVKVQDLILKELKSGVALNKVYLSIMQFVTEKRPDLLKYITKNFGEAIGIKLFENCLSISYETTTKAQENMTFNVNVGLVNLFNRETNSRYSLWIADTVFVQKNESISLTTFGTHWRGMCLGYEPKKTRRQADAPFRTVGNVSNLIE